MAIANYLTTHLSQHLWKVFIITSLPYPVKSIFETLIYCWFIFESLSANSELALIWLTEKLTLLLLILSEQQKQTLLARDIDNVKIYEEKLIIIPNFSLKHTKSSLPLQAIVYHKFNGNLKLCVVECAKLYIQIRNKLVSPEIEQFLVTYGKPHIVASDDTIFRWIKNTISSPGIDVYLFKAHSTRSTSSSKAKQVGSSYTEILKRFLERCQ